MNAHSQWRADHSAIVTTYEFSVSATLAGPPVHQLLIETEGGYLADEALGLWVSHHATLEKGESALLFLDTGANHYEINGGEWGKFTVQQDTMLNRDLQATVAASDIPTAVEPRICADWPTTDNVV
ncbi:MAG: hypothetical protein R2932_17990 [Caldilineaceae bacterium]